MSALIDLDLNGIEHDNNKRRKNQQKILKEIFERELEDDEFEFNSVFSFATKTKNNYEKAYVKTIENFNAAQGDQIELSYIGYNHLMRFTTERNLTTWKRGDVIFKVEGNDGWIYGNLDKDKDAEIQIKLLGVTVFVEGSIDLTL